MPDRTVLSCPKQSSHSFDRHQLTSLTFIAPAPSAMPHTTVTTQKGQANLKKTPWWFFFSLYTLAGLLNASKTALGTCPDSHCLCINSESWYPRQHLQLFAGGQLARLAKSWGREKTTPPRCQQALPLKDSPWFHPFITSNSIEKTDRCFRF